MLAKRFKVMNNNMLKLKNSTKDHKEYTAHTELEFLVYMRLAQIYGLNVKTIRPSSIGKNRCYIMFSKNSSDISLIMPRSPSFCFYSLI